MARVTYVKKAQQRYQTVPVLDEHGQPKRVPVLRRDGSPKKTKSGREVTMRVTIEDKSKPKPLRVCDHCQKPIEIGTPYKWVKPKSGPYGGATRSRHAGCPTWQVWDLSNSLSAQLARISADANSTTYTDADEVRQALTDAAEAIREIAEQKEESAQNIEDGFQHETEQSNELRGIAEQLNTWADEVEQRADDVEDRPDETKDCLECGGSGQKSGDSDDDDGIGECEECGGSGEVDNEDEIAEWETQVEDWMAIVDESPV